MPHLRLACARPGPQDMLFSLLPSCSPNAAPPPSAMRAPRHAFVYAVRLGIFCLGVGLSYGAQHAVGTVVSLVSGPSLLVQKWVGWRGWAGLVLQPLTGGGASGTGWR